MVFVTMLAVTFSIVNGSLSLAVLAVVGGFSAPYLISTGQNDPYILFTYIAILDIAIIVLSVVKKWTLLSTLLFIGTSVQYLLWYFNFYTPTQLPVAFSFLTLFFFIFLAVPSVYLIINGGKTKEWNVALALWNAISYFGAAFLLLQPLYHESIWLLALALSAVYYGLAFHLHLILPSNLVSKFYTGIGTLFLTLSIAYKLEHPWMSLAWILESVLLYVVAFNFKKESFQWFGSIVYILGVSVLTADYISRNKTANPPFFNEYVVLFIIAICAAYFITYLYYKNSGIFKDGSSGTLANFYFVIANALCIFIVTNEISTIYANNVSVITRDAYNSVAVGDLSNQRNTVISIFWSIYSILLITVGFIAKVRVVRLLGLLFFFITASKIFFEVWSLGEIYRIVASIVFGAIALLASFMYVRYSERIKEIIYQN